MNLNNMTWSDPVRSTYSGLFPEMVIPKILSSIQDLTWQSLKEHSHDVVLNIDKIVTSGIFYSTILVEFDCADFLGIRPGTSYLQA